uniref:Uncharacterized protein n=1 Tax=Graphocephala atropunctata TaxID=36148 RepID=A0A1B6L0B9_9HEMI
MRYLQVFLWCAVTPLVFSDDGFDLKRQIADMNENAKLLEEENRGLAQKLDVVKQECEAQLVPLRERREEFVRKNQMAVQILEELNNNLTQKEQEEAFLIKAINREIIIHNKYSLKIELYNHELDLFRERQQNSISEKCHLLKPLFQKYESALSVRSFNIRKKYSPKDYIIVLQNQLNQVKLVVQGLQNKNQELRNEIVSFGKLCESKKESIIQLIQTSEEALRNAMNDIDLVKIELEQYIAIVEKLTLDLQELKQKNERLRGDSIRLKNEVAGFAVDNECYAKISVLKINYE